MSLTLKINSALYLGLSQSQRSVGQAAASYSDTVGDDVYQIVGAGQSFTVPDSVTAFTAFTDVPLTVNIDSQPPFTMTELMTYDAPVAALTFTNNGKTSANLHLTYVGSAPTV